MAQEPEEDPVLRYQQIEGRVLGARSVTLEADVTADEPLGAQLKAHVTAAPGNRMTLAATGRLRGKPVALQLQCDGHTLLLKSGTVEVREPVGTESNRALLMGLLRTGLLHNLDRAAELRAPDHAGGGTDRWAGLEYFHLVQALDHPGSYILSFDVTAEGLGTGRPEIYLDPASGLPARREETITVQREPVHVVESYTRFVVE